MKLLKAPDPDEPWVALHWVEMPKYHWIYWDSDGTTHHDIGPIELTQVMFEVTKPDGE